MMALPIGRAATYIVYSVICFLVARRVESPSIHYQVCGSRPVTSAYRLGSALSERLTALFEKNVIFK